MPSNDLYSDIIPFNYTWKTEKDDLNHIPMNMIGSAHNSRKILEDSDLPIFPVVLITPKDLRYSAALWYHIIHLLCGG